MFKNWLSYKEMKGSFHWDEPCYLTNQWILKDELFYLIIPPAELKSKHQLENYVIKKEAWEKFIVCIETEEELAIKLKNHKKPRRKPHSEEQLENIEYFKEACEYYGFYKCVVSRDKRFIKMKKRKTPFTIIYDVVYHRLSYDIRANEGLFGGLFSREILSKIYNKMNELQGLEERSDYSAVNVINKAIEDTNKLIGK